MERHLVELEKRIEKTAVPEIWVNNQKVTLHLIDFLKESGEKVEESVSPWIWMGNTKIIERLVGFFKKKVEKQQIGSLPNAHLPDTLIAIYIVYYKDISMLYPEAIQLVRKHLKKCKICFHNVNELYGKHFWKDPEQIKKAVDGIIQSAEKTAKEEGNLEVWKSIQELRKIRGRQG